MQRDPTRELDRGAIGPPSSAHAVAGFWELLGGGVIQAVDRNRPPAGAGNRQHWESVHFRPVTPVDP